MASYSTKFETVTGQRTVVVLLCDGVAVARMPLEEFVELSAVTFAAQEAVTRVEDQRAADLDPAAGAEAGEMPRRPRRPC
jgi:hypothetical protein